MLVLAMKFKGYTDTSDWNVSTLLSMASDPNLWMFGATWREWRFGFDYVWYDGPIFQLRVGPFWASVCHH